MLVVNAIVAASSAEVSFARLLDSTYHNRIKSFKGEFAEAIHQKL